MFLESTYNEAKSYLFDSYETTKAELCEIIDEIADGFESTINCISDPISYFSDIGNWKLKYNRRNFRINFMRYTGELGIGKEAHHVFPVRFVDDFSAIGINVHDPQFGAWVDIIEHHKWSYRYNQEWKSFFSNPNNGQKEAFAFAKQLAHEYQFKIYFGGN